METFPNRQWFIKKISIQVHGFRLKKIPSFKLIHFKLLFSPQFQYYLSLFILFTNLVTRIIWWEMNYLNANYSFYYFFVTQASLIFNYNHYLFLDLLRCLVPTIITIPYYGDWMRFLWAATKIAGYPIFQHAPKW